MSTNLDPGLDDLTLVWLYAANCSLYEEDDGPAELNIGSSLEPRWVSRVEAFRDLYAHLLLEQLAADPARIAALTRQVHRAGKRNSSAAALWGIAADLCQRARDVIEGAGAVDDARARRRLLAGTRHLNHTVVLGSWVPGYQVEADNDLLQELAEADE
ncbi:MAG TPA: hypothetical protein VLZ05_14575 [Mycobacterium sp.]|jgi:hypothetical protein|nr:hypothetical protein [Mycobacterium sp.]HUH69964.1 hypothetical protein [Mycobacterium sp.]